MYQPRVMFKKYFILSVLFTIYFCHAGFSQKILKGEVVDAKTAEAIPYVSIGVYGENVGTISKEDGSFNLSLVENNMAVSITFSCIGYKSKSVPISILKANPKVFLEQEILLLDEVVLEKSKKLKQENKKIGGYKQSIYNTGEANTDAYGKGKEYGIKIDNTGFEYKIDKINFSLKENTIDSILFRMNLYKLSSDGLPKESILKNQLFVKSYKNEHLITIDVSDESLFVNEDVVVTIEPVRLWYKSSNDNMLFYAQTKGRNIQTFLRETSMSNWIVGELPPFSIFFDITYYK